MPYPTTPDPPLDAAALDRLAERRPWLYTLNDAAFDGLIAQARAALALRDEVARLLAQLPDGMQHCTILYKKCNKGHGRLTATNWVQYDCHWCEIARLRALLVEGAQVVGPLAKACKQWVDGDQPPLWDGSTLPIIVSAAYLRQAAAWIKRAAGESV